MQQHANAFRHFIKATEYGGKGHCGLLKISKGIEGRGWKYFSIELKKTLFTLLPVNRHVAFALRLDISVDERKEKGMTSRLFAKVVMGRHGKRAIVLGGSDQAMTSQEKASCFVELD